MIKSTNDKKTNHINNKNIIIDIRIINISNKLGDAFTWKKNQ